MITLVGANVQSFFSRFLMHVCIRVFIPFVCWRERHEKTHLQPFEKISAYKNKMIKRTPSWSGIPLSVTVWSGGKDGTSMLEPARV